MQGAFLESHDGPQKHAHTRRQWRVRHKGNKKKNRLETWNKTSDGVQPINWRQSTRFETSLL